MSTPLGVAAVTAVLEDLLHNGVVAYDLDKVLGDIRVSAMPPDRVPLSGQDVANRLNLFLYQATPNQGWRNAELPSRDSRGDRISNPPLGLDLHYLLTAYGTKELFPEILLGHGMQLFHDNPVLTRDAIRKALSPAGPLPDFPKELATSELAEQVEQLKITPEQMSTEDISKIWTALQASYRPTAAYQVTVVLLQSKRSTRAALPVQERNIYVLPFRQPMIEQVVSAEGDAAPIVATSTILLRGRQLRAPGANLMIGGLDLTSSAAFTDTLITIKLPTPLPQGFYAGLHAVQVVHPIPMGTPPEDHLGTESNLASLVLRPTITVPAGQASQTVKIGFTPKVGQRQRVRLLLNELNAPANRAPLAFTLEAPKDNGVTSPATETDSIRFDSSKVAKGLYLVRAQVSGAESLLAPDPSGVLAKPKVKFV